MVQASQLDSLESYSPWLTKTAQRKPYKQFSFLAKRLPLTLRILGAPLPKNGSSGVPFLNPALEPNVTVGLTVHHPLFF